MQPEIWESGWDVGTGHTGQTGQTGATHRLALDCLLCLVK